MFGITLRYELDPLIWIGNSSTSKYHTSIDYKILHQIPLTSPIH